MLERFTRRALGVIVVTLCFTGCGASLAKQKDLVARRAAFDLDCPQEQVEVIVIDEESHAFGVKACGHKRSYDLRCIGLGQCTFVGDRPAAAGE